MAVNCGASRHGLCLIVAASLSCRDCRHSRSYAYFFHGGGYAAAVCFCCRRRQHTHAAASPRRVCPPSAGRRPCRPAVGSRLPPSMTGGPQPLPQLAALPEDGQGCRCCAGLTPPLCCGLAGRGREAKPPASPRKTARSPPAAAREAAYSPARTGSACPSVTLLLLLVFVLLRCAWAKGKRASTARTGRSQVWQ